MKKEKIKFCLNLCLHFVLQVIFSHINLFGKLSFAGLPFAFIQLYLKTNVFAVVGFYFISKIYLFDEIKWILIVAYEIVFLALYYFINDYIKENKKVLILELFLILANVLSLYFSFDLIENFVFFLINFVLEIILLLYFFKFNITYKNKIIFYKFSRNDYFIFSMMVLLLSLGIFSFDFVYEKLALFVLVATILFGAKILKTDRFLICVIIMMIGAVISSREFFLFEIGVILSLFCLLFKDFNKWLYAGINICFVAIIMIIFNIYDIFSIFSVIFAFFIYIVMPNKIIQFFANVFETDAVSVIFKKREESKTENIKNKLLIMADTLKNMQENFKLLLVGKIDRESACTELSSDVIKKCCSECENYKFCFMENINKKVMFENMLLKAIENKSFSISDLSTGIQTYCHKSGIVASEISQMSKLFLSYESAMKTQDESKLLISSEIGNFADIFKNFAKTIKNNEKINEKLSKNLKDSLINAIIDVKEVLIFENENGIKSINMIASNEQILKRELVETISKSVRTKVSISKIEHLEQSGFSLVEFKPEPKINIQFAVSAKAKDGKNGDSSVISKISDNVYFVAIADGMGHGDEASKMSSMVLRLIKSMFEVGLDYNLVIDSVNKLLIPVGVDKFTTLDACVIDLNKNECLFIKLGSSVSILKHQEKSEIVSSASLPIGVVKNIAPTVLKKQIFQDDMIFLASDGVVDSFSSVQAYGTFINDSKIYNMQRFLDNVIFDAESMNQSHLDDMTIIGVNLLKN